MATIVLISAILNAFLGFLVYRKSKTKVQKGFAYVALVIGFWLFVNFIYFKFYKYPFVNLSYTVGAIVIYIIFCWAAAYAKVKLKKSTYILFASASLISAIISIIRNLMLDSDHMEKIAYGFSTPKTGWFLVFSLISVIIFGCSIWFLVKKHTRSSGLEKIKDSYILFGFGVPIVTVVIVDFILPFITKTWIDSLDTLASLIFVSIIGFSLTKNQFLDIRIVIRKSAIQLLTFIIVFGIYAYVLLLIQRLTADSVEGVKSETSLLLAIVIIALTIEPLRRTVFKAIDSRFESKEKMHEESLKRLEILSASQLQFDSLCEKTKTELSAFCKGGIDFLLLNQAKSEFRKYPEVNDIFLLQGNVAQMAIAGNTLIQDELKFKVDEGEDEFRQTLQWMQNEKVAAIIPLGKNKECVGAFILYSTNKTIFTKDKVDFINSFAARAYYSFASALAYKYAVERIMM